MISLLLKKITDKKYFFILFLFTINTGSDSAQKQIVYHRYYPQKNIQKELPVIPEYPLPPICKASDPYPFLESQALAYQEQLIDYLQSLKKYHKDKEFFLNFITQSESTQAAQQQRILLEKEEREKIP
ncbi:hypothetical protein HYV11_01840 [Candidatus Dependentiae bacterium]|nr:hypothetical protein [Candidatus Dependentiae bacterium]